ncbi:MAG: nucleotidyltransferase family protein, partial [Actinomycetota bacterium]
VGEVAFNLHHLPEDVTGAVGDGAAFGLRVRYSVEPELLGSAGALNGFPGFFDERFFVVYGDVYHRVDPAVLAAFHEARSAVLTIAATTADDPSTKGVLECDESGRVRTFVEKPPDAPPGALVNAGVYACEPRVAALVPPGVSDFGADLIPSMIAAGEPVYALFTSALVQDIGTPEGLARARALASDPGSAESNNTARDESGNAAQADPF